MSPWLLIVIVFMLLLVNATKSNTNNNNNNSKNESSSSSSESSESLNKPNILFILTDDWGNNDVGWTNFNSDALTPFLDKLALKEGLILSNYYVERVCTATRGSFLTGRYPSVIGLQSGVCAPNQPASLTRQVSILSEELSYNGYNTHIIGKWHLGFQSYEYTPLYRGFDSFYGFYCGGQDYYTHISHSFMKQVNAYDLYKNIYPVTGMIGIYGVWWQRDETLKLLQETVRNNKPFFIYLALQASHNPRQAPEEYIKMYSNCSSNNPISVLGNECNENYDRITFKAQTTTVDDTVKDIVKYLKSEKLWDNTLVIIGSDNGGKRHFGDNAPYRGFKNTSWEGGVKVPGFITGGYLNENQRGKVLDYSMHIVDWYPTLLAASGLEITYQRSKKLLNSLELDTRWDKVPDIPLDGINMWEYIQYGFEDHNFFYNQRELLLDLKDVFCPFESCGAIKIGNYKYIRGNNIASLLPTYDDGDQWFRDYSSDQNKAETFCVQHYEKFIIKHDIRFGLNKLDTMGCQNTQKGCLFDLSLDACEYYDLSEKYPKLVMEFQKRLNAHQKKATKALIGENNPNELFPKEKIDPKFVCSNSLFWCPFQKYEDVQFEYLLYFTYRAYNEINTEYHSETVSTQTILMYIGIMIIPILFIIGIGLFIYYWCYKSKRRNQNNDYIQHMLNKVEVEPLLDAT